MKESTAKGFFWAALSNGTQQVVMMLIGIVLANILSVEDYGMVAMLTAFSVIAGNLQEGGFTSALCVKKEARHEDFNAVFWLSMMVSVTVYVALFFCAPLIAEFNHTPELTLLGRVIFIGFVFSSMGTAHAAYLFRNLMVKQKTMSQVLSSMLSGVFAIIAAVAGWGVWSLVVMDLSYKMIYTALIWYFSPWRPSFNIDLRPAFRIFGFGSRLLVTNLLTTLNNQFLQTILGHYYPDKQVGQYSQANKWNTMCSTLLTNMVGNVAQPVLASVNEEEGRQVRIFRKMLRFTAMLSFPALFGFAVIAPEFIPLTIGEKWLPCVPYLQTLSVVGAVLPLCQLFSNLIISKQQSTTYLCSTAAFLVLQLTLVLLLYPYGVQILLYGISALNVLWLFVWSILARRLSGITVLQTLGDILPFLFAALLAIGGAACVGYFISNLLLCLLAKIVVAVMIYAVIMQLAKVQIWKECVAFIFAKILRKKQK